MHTPLTARFALLGMCPDNFGFLGREAQRRSRPEDKREKRGFATTAGSFSIAISVARRVPGV